MFLSMMGQMTMCNVRGAPHSDEPTLYYHPTLQYCSHFIVLVLWPATLLFRFSLTSLITIQHHAKACNTPTGPSCQCHVLPRLGMKSTHLYTQCQQLRLAVVVIVTFKS